MNNNGFWIGWIYWHFFTITINYDSSESMILCDSLYSLLDYECLLFHCDESQRTPAHKLNSLMTAE
jgi:hypothetical protein